MEPLTPEDIAEVIVFAAGRRENVVIADTMILPNHQVCSPIDARAMSEGDLPLGAKLFVQYQLTASKAAATVMHRKST